MTVWSAVTKNYSPIGGLTRRDSIRSSNTATFKKNGKKKKSSKEEDSQKESSQAQESLATINEPPHSQAKAHSVRGFVFVIFWLILKYANHFTR